MTSPNALSARLRKLEARAAAKRPADPCTRIITESDEDRDRQLAALAAAGLYAPGRGLLIDRRIVDPKPSVLQ